MQETAHGRAMDASDALAAITLEATSTHLIDVTSEVSAEATSPCIAKGVPPTGLEGSTKLPRVAATDSSSNVGSGIDATIEATARAKSSFIAKGAPNTASEGYTKFESVAATDSFTTTDAKLPSAKCAADAESTVGPLIQDVALVTTPAQEAQAFDSKSSNPTAESGPLDGNRASTPSTAVVNVSSTTTNTSDVAPPTAIAKASVPVASRATGATDAQATDALAAEALEATDGAFPSVDDAIEVGLESVPPSGFDSTGRKPGLQTALKAPLSMHIQVKVSPV